MLEVEFDYNNYHSNDYFHPIDKSDVELLDTYRLNGDEFNYDQMVKNKEVIILNNEVAKEIYGWEFKAEDKIKIRWYNGTEYCEDIFTVAGDFNSNKLAKDDNGHKFFLNSGWFLVPDKVIQNMMPEEFNINDGFIISTENYENNNKVITIELEKLADNNPNLILHTLAEEIEYKESIYSSMYAIVFGLSAFIIGFSFINLINTLVSNAMSRKQEFAVLRSIGMSEKQLSKMIKSEGIILAFKNILITLIFGTAIGYLLVLLLNEVGADYMHWNFPWVYHLGYDLLTIIVPVLISEIIVFILRKKSLVEKLREVE